MYSQGGNAYFDFAGILRATVNLQDKGAPGITSDTPWNPVVEGEPASYGVQMPGTSGNHERWTNLQSRRWCGSSTCWDGTGDQGWATSGTTLPAIGSVHFDLPVANPGGVSQTRVNNSFKNTHDAGPNISAWDACTTS